jgi:hypothetical protein
MSEHEREPDGPGAEGDERLREAQEGTGYGEDEGERDAGLERESGGSGEDDSGERSDPDAA